MRDIVTESFEDAIDEATPREDRVEFETCENQPNDGRLDLQPLAVDTRETVTLEEWRRRMEATRIESIGKPGVYIDRSPTGAGKSYADASMLKRVERSLTVVPTHALANELAAEMAKVHKIVGVAVMPAVDADTCENYTEAKKAQDAGLIVSTAICPGCKFRKECPLKDAVNEAKKARHLVATHDRLSHQVDQLTQGRDVLSIHEDARKLLRPMQSCKDAEIDAVERIAQHALSFPETINNQMAAVFFAKLASVARAVRLCMANAAEVTELPRSNDEAFPPYVGRRSHGRRRANCLTGSPARRCRSCRTTSQVILS